MKNDLRLPAIVGALGVVTGAFGAHALKEKLTSLGTVSTWNTSVLYHIFHALALLSISLYALTKPQTSAWLARSRTCWTLGILLFSGSLYIIALDGPRWFGPITPLGGIFLILGWACLLGIEVKTGSSSKK
jgi:uncharacterized membrane protein YgdD (TMEM256/DUF423 family)